MYKVLLYYKYCEISDPNKLMVTQREVCEKNNIKGRILISEEGLNGTVGGKMEDLEIYMKKTEKEVGKIDWKISDSEIDPFPKLKVKVRPEVVTLGLKKKGNDVDLGKKAKYIEPKELIELYENNKEFYIIDGRNEYEFRVGKFKNAVTLPVDNFRDIPKKLEEIENLKDKKVVTFCTGGIRCEKFSALLVENGFKDVSQLKGGIHRYSDETGGKYFEGELYVFDARVHIPINTVNPKIISVCHHCGEKIARFVNCANVKCNKQIICCESCEEKTHKTCSKQCEKEFLFQEQTA